MEKYFFIVFALLLLTFLGYLVNTICISKNRQDEECVHAVCPKELLSLSKLSSSESDTTSVE